jgi:alpha-L-arabinofuranosidase
MKIKNGRGLFVAIIALLLGVIAASAEVVVPAGISVDENHPIKPVDLRMLGFNHEWAGQYPVCDIPNEAGYNTNVVTALSGLSMPINRMSGTVAMRILWKGAIGPYANRATQQLTSWYNKKIGCGPVEWLQMIKAIDPAAGVTWTVNLFESANDTADLVEFLTGDGLSNPNGGTNWAQVRIGYGITNPVIVDVWELGNELDGTGVLNPLDDPDDPDSVRFRDGFQNITNYTDLCKPFITAIRSVQPDAKIAAHAMTHSSYNDYQAFFGVPWTEWHRNVLREIGDDIDYIAFHTYYNSLPSSSMESHVNQIADDISSASYTTNTQIKIYLSEHAWWPKTNDCPPESTTEWKDSWYTTHALMGCLGTADWMTRMMNSPAVEIASYHAFCGGPWGLVYKSAAGDLYTTGMAGLYGILADAFRDGISIVPVSVSGQNTDRSSSQCMFTAAALTTSAGVNLILVNRDTNTARSVDLSSHRQYALIEKTVFTAPSMLSYNTAASRPITVTRTLLPSGEPISAIKVPAKSMVVLKVRASVVSADFNAYTAPNVIMENTTTGATLSNKIILTDSVSAGTFTAWGAGYGTNSTYSVKVLGDNAGNNYLRLNAVKGTSAFNLLAQVSTTEAYPLSGNWAVKTRFSAIAGSGSLYFGLYAAGAMNSIGGYEISQIILANTNKAAVALGFSISQTGSATIARTAANNKLEFWNGSAWQAGSISAFSGLDVTGAKQYELVLSTDGATLNIRLINAATSATMINLDFPVSALGSNVTSANIVRFSAGDIANNSTDGWAANIYSLSHILPVAALN